MNNRPRRKHNSSLSSMNPKQFSCTLAWHGTYGEEQGRTSPHGYNLLSVTHKSAQKMRQLTSSRGCGRWLWGVFTPCSPNSTCHQILEARWHCNRWRCHTWQSCSRNTWRRMQKAGNCWTARASTMVCRDGRVQDWGLQYTTFMSFYRSVSTANVMKCQMNYMGNTDHFQPFNASRCALHDLIPCISLTSAHSIDSTLGCSQFKTLSPWAIFGIKTQDHWRVQVLFCYWYLSQLSPQRCKHPNHCMKTYGQSCLCLSVLLVGYIWACPSYKAKCSDTYLCCWSSRWWALQQTC